MTPTATETKPKASPRTKRPSTTKARTSTKQRPTATKPRATPPAPTSASGTTTEHAGTVRAAAASGQSGVCAVGQGRSWRGTGLDRWPAERWEEREGFCNALTVKGKGPPCRHTAGWDTSHVGTGTCSRKLPAHDSVSAIIVRPHFGQISRATAQPSCPATALRFRAQRAGFVA